MYFSYQRSSHVWVESLSAILRIMILDWFLSILNASELERKQAIKQQKSYPKVEPKQTQQLTPEKCHRQQMESRYQTQM